MRAPDPDEDGKHGLGLEEHEAEEEIIGRPERVTYISESQEDFDDADIEESENGDQNALSVMDVATGMSISWCLSLHKADSSACSFGLDLHDIHSSSPGHVAFAIVGSQAHFLGTGYVHWAALDKPTPAEQKALMNSSLAIGAVLLFLVTAAMMVILTGVYVVAEIRSN
jgi:hypothetical protein